MRREGIIEMIRGKFGEDKVLNIITFKTETSKSAILTSCRGLNIPLEEAQALADLIPIVRGKPYTLKECLEGNGEDKEAVPSFIKLVNSYNGLLEIALKIEGIISGISSHASGLYLFNDNFVEQNSLMKTPKGLSITCWEMQDSDKAGALKVDLLTVANLDMIHETFNLLLKDKKIEYQGNLRATYNKYISPDVLDYSSKDMFNILGTEKGNNIFQLSTDMGLKACKMIKPQSVSQMGLVNSLMRLQSDGMEAPLEKYERFSKNIEEWYKEMAEANLSPEEIKTLEKYLLKNNGICAEQEDLMEISMCPEISNFSMTEANKLRKAIAKKKEKLIKECKELYYSKGLEAGTRKEMLDYVWDKQFSLSLGYSFSRNHSVPYSCIGLQQLNLLYHYSAIYSQCAALLVDSSSNEGNETDGVDYGKIATSVCHAKNNGVNFSPIDINEAEKGFIPIESENKIIAGFKGISGINNDFAEKIIENRPYKSTKEFVDKLNPLKSQMISLIKAGAFDKFNEDRAYIMKQYFRYIITNGYKYKFSLTGKDLGNIEELGLLPEEYKIYWRYYNFNKYITSPNFVYKKEGRKTFLIAKEIGLNFFEQYYLNDLVEDIDYEFTKEGIIFNKTSYNKCYKKRMQKVLDFINQPNFIEKFNSLVIEKNIEELWNKYCEGHIQDWELDAYNYYIGEHALKNVNTTKYNISEFHSLPEQPTIEEEYEYKGRTCYKYALSRICGVVIDSDRLKHIITLLTHTGEVVKVKYYAGQFINYNSKIAIEENGKKVTKEESWFKRGRLLILVGYRNDDMFIPKTYKDSIYRHSTALIEDYTEDGNLIIRELRYGEKEKNWRNNS